jgi:hypothetical protein
MTDLIDPEDGENRAVRSFLALYGCAGGIDCGQMVRHMKNSGFNVVPDWAASNPRQHLTKAGAQLWLRMLFALEKPAQAT